MDNYVKGVCLDMCPLEEVEMREKEKMLHVLEMIPGTEKSKSPKANRNFVVKCYSRSAAGKTVNKAENLRPPEVLLRTVSYLLFDVINSNCLPWHSIYDFITDRLMAVRQDMVVQNIPIAESITLLQPIVNFHAYAAYKLCNENFHNFDPVLNNKHLQECLKKLLNLYDNCETTTSMDKDTICYNYLIENRPEFESLYIIFNLGNEEALGRALVIPEKYKTEIVKNAIDLSVCFIFGNFIRICRLMKNLPPLHSAVASLFLPKIRRKALQIMSVAYHSKTLSFPIDVLMNILLYSSNSQLSEDCNYYGVKTDNQNVYFFKQSFIATKSALNPRHEAFVEDKLKKEYLHCILLGQ